jgi:hypothetical protein
VEDEEHDDSINQSESQVDGHESGFHADVTSSSATSSQNASSGQGFWGKKPSSVAKFDQALDSDVESSWSRVEGDHDFDENHESSSSINSKQNCQRLDSDDDSSILGAPLTRGLGFENPSYSDLLKRGRKESIASSDELNIQS